MITYFIGSCYAVLKGGETNITPSPLTNRKGTVRLVVCNQKENKRSSKEIYLRNNVACICRRYFNVDAD